MLTWKDDVALGLTGQETGTWQKKLDGGWIFGRRVAVRPASVEVDSCTVGSYFPRSFQRRRRCCDQSLVAREPRVMAPELWAARRGSSRLWWGWFWRGWVKLREIFPTVAEVSLLESGIGRTEGGSKSIQRWISFLAAQATGFLTVAAGQCQRQLRQRNNAWKD